MKVQSAEGEKKKDGSNALMKRVEQMVAEVITKKEEAKLLEEELTQHNAALATQAALIRQPGGSPRTPGCRCQSCWKHRFHGTS